MTFTNSVFLHYFYSDKTKFWRRIFKKSKEFIMFDLRQSYVRFDQFAKTLNQHHPAEVRQMRLVERKTQCLQAFAHNLGR